MIHSFIEEHPYIVEVRNEYPPIVHDFANFQEAYDKYQELAKNNSVRLCVKTILHSTLWQV